MSKRSRHSRRLQPRPEPQPVPQATKRTCRWVAGALLLLLLGAGLWVGLADRIPKFRLDLANLDPALARLFENVLQEARASPRSDRAWGRVGEVFLMHGFHAEARIAFARAEKLQPAEPRWPYLQALTIDKVGETDAAIPRLQRAVELGPTQADIPRLQLAQCQLRLGRLDQAQEQFQLLLRGNPDHPVALLGLARIASARGDLARSLELINRCAGDGHVSRSAYSLLACLQQRAGNTDAAQAAALKYATLPPDLAWPDPWQEDLPQFDTGKWARLDEAKGLILQQRLDAALSVLSGITNDYPQDDEPYLRMGAVLNRQGRWIDGERVLRHYLRLATNSVRGQDELASSLLNQQRYAEAAAVLESALQGQAESPRLHQNLAYAYQRLGRDEEAIGHLQSAVRYGASDGNIYAGLCDLLRRRGRTNEAEAVLRQALIVHPSDQRLRGLLK